MSVLDLLSVIFYNLKRRKDRVLLTGLGVVIGSASVVLMVSLSSGLQRGATSQFGRLSDLKRIEVYPGMGQMMMMGGGGGENQPQMTTITPSLISKIKQIEGVDEVILQENLKTTYTIEYGRLTTYASVVGVSIQDLSPLDFIFTEGKPKIGPGVAIIGGWAAKNFINPNAKTGQQDPQQPPLLDKLVRVILTKNSSDGKETRKVIYLRIGGILKEARSSQDNNIYVRIEDVTSWNEWASGKRVNRNKDGYDSIVVIAKEVKQSTAIAEEINQMGLMAYTPQMVVQGINSFFTVLQIFFGAIGAISLLVAAIGIANTMTMSVLERTAEIGLIKAIGASDEDVLRIFIGEASGIGFLGGIGGIIVGWAGGQLLNMVALVYFAKQALKGAGGAPPESIVYTPLWLILAASILSTLVGMISGYFPARRAMQMAPVAALKHE